MIFPFEINKYDRTNSSQNPMDSRAVYMKNLSSLDDLIVIKVMCDKKLTQCTSREIFWSGAAEGSGQWRGHIAVDTVALASLLTSPA